MRPHRQSKRIDFDTRYSKITLIRNLRKLKLIRDLSKFTLIRDLRKTI